MEHEALRGDPIQTELGGTNPEAPTLRKKPTGVVVLTVLIGLASLSLFIVLFTRLPIVDSDVPPLTMDLMVFFLAVLSLASAVGMFLGEPWGWWLGGSYQVSNLLLGAKDMLPALRSVDRFDEFLLRLIGVLITFFIVTYLFRDYVRRYFRMEQLSPLKAVPILVFGGTPVFAVARLIPLL